MSQLIDGRYEILAKVKDGGMGTVYKVRHVHLDQVRVVKVMRPQIVNDEVARARFFQEAKLAKGLEHPNIATLHDFAEDRDGVLYMALEFVDGPSLNEYHVAGGPPPVEAVVAIAVQALRALGYLHRRGIVHRDVSPENVLLTLGRDGEPVAKLIDFGIAKVAEEQHGVTQTGMFLGKLKYTSPEQLGALKKGQRIDGRSDVYSMGCVLYQLLSGELPFRADTPQAWAMSHLMKPPRPFDETDSGFRVPEEVRQVVLRALAKEREERFPDAETMAAALEGWLGSVPGDRRAAATADTVVRIRLFRDAFAAQEAATGVYVASASVPVGGVLATPATAQPVPQSPDRASPTQQTVAVGDRPHSRRRAVVRAGVAAALLAVGGLLLLRTVRRPVPVATGSLLLDSTPWATLVSVAAESGEPVSQASGSTPIRLELPAGRYRLVLRGGPGGTGEVTVAAEVSPGRERALHVDLPGFDLEKVVRAHAP